MSSPSSDKSTHSDTWLAQPPQGHDVRNSYASIALHGSYNPAEIGRAVSVSVGAAQDERQYEVKHMFVQSQLQGPPQDDEESLLSGTLSLVPLGRLDTIKSAAAPGRSHSLTMNTALGEVIPPRLKKRPVSELITARPKHTHANRLSLISDDLDKLMESAHAMQDEAPTRVVTARSMPETETKAERDETEGEEREEKTEGEEGEERETAPTAQQVVALAGDLMTPTKTLPTGIVPRRQLGQRSPERLPAGKTSLHTASTTSFQTADNASLSSTEIKPLLVPKRPDADSLNRAREVSLTRASRANFSDSELVQTWQVAQDQGAGSPMARDSLSHYVSDRDPVKESPRVPTVPTVPRLPLADKRTSLPLNQPLDSTQVDMELFAPEAEGTPDQPDDDDGFSDVGEPVLVLQPARAKLVKEHTKMPRRKSSRRRLRRSRLSEETQLKPFSYNTLVHLLESINGAVIGEEFEALSLPVAEKQMIEKIVDLLSRLTLDMVVDKNRYEIGMQRLERAHRVLEGFL